MRRGLLLLAVAFLSLSNLMDAAYCWSNGGFSTDPSNPKYGTHDWIAEHALDWLPSDVKGWILENLNWYLYGTELPDNGRAPDGVGDTGFHHVYYSADRSLADDSAARRANETFSQALALMLSSDFASAAKYAGAMTHYVADAAVFGHVMGAGTDWGAEVHHSDYEDYVNSKTSAYSSEWSANLRFDGALNAITAYDAAVELAYDTTFDRLGRGLTCVWMDKNYNWSDPTFRARAGESLNLAVNYVADVLYALYAEYLKVSACQVNSYIHDDSGNVVSGATIIFAGSSYTHGSSTSVASGSYSLSTGAIPNGYRFLKWETSGGVSVSSPMSSSTTAAVSGPGSITMRLQRTTTATFSVSGMGSDASGTVLTVDGVGYTYTDLPKSFTWDVGSTHAFAWSDLVGAGTGKRYLWVSTSGLSTAKSGSFAVPSGGGSITASYETQYSWTLSASGLGPDASGTIVTVDGANYAHSSLPASFWWDSGSSHSYSYQQYVSTTTGGKRYANHSPPSGTVTASSSGGVNPSYHTEYLLTVSVSPQGSGSVSLSPLRPDGWYDSGTTVTATAAPAAGYALDRWVLDDVAYTGSSLTFQISSPHSLVARFASPPSSPNLALVVGIALAAAIATAAALAVKRREQRRGAFRLTRRR